MKTPKFKQPEAEKVTPMPDPQGAQSMQARFDALKGALARRGRSSTILTYGRRAGATGGAVALSGRLSDVDGGRTAGATVGRL